MKAIKKGSKGGAVIELQKKLGLEADGLFGPATEIAVMKFQAENGLLADGIVGAKTWAKLAGEAAPEEPAEVRPASEPPISTRAQALERYGQIKDGKWANQSKWMKYVEIPEEIGENWLLLGKEDTPTKRIYCNKDMAEQLLRALQNVKDRELLEELKTFDGCFAIRDVRGVPGSVSTHAYGLAIDINADENGLGKKPKLSAKFVRCFKDAGFTWGGDFRRKDGMHFSFAWE
jgi:hypothetical protein